MHDATISSGETPASADDLSARLDELTRLVGEQRAELAALRAAHAELPANAVGPSPTDRRGSRREFLRLAGAAAAGAVGAAAAGAAATASPAGAAAGDDPYPQYVLASGDTVTGKLTVTGARSLPTATEIGNGDGALTAFSDGDGVDLGSKHGRPLRLRAQTRWDSDDDRVIGSNLDINTPAVVLRQTGEDHKGALVEFQQHLEAGPHEMGVATNTPHRVFNVASAGPKRVGWITAHYNSPNPIDDIHQHMNFETCKADLATVITRFQISWGEDVALCSFPNSNVRVIQTNKTLSFGSNNEVQAVVGGSGRLSFTGKPVSFAVGQLQVAGATVRPMLFARKTANEVVTGSAVLQGDNELFVTLDAGATYTFTLFLNWSSDPSADLKVALSPPAGATILWSPDAFGTAAASTTASPKQSVEGTAPVTIGGVGASTRLGMAATGIVRTGATAGPLRLLWAQNRPGASPTTVHRDSFLQLTRMA